MTTPTASSASWGFAIPALVLLSACGHQPAKLPSKVLARPSVTVVPVLAENERFTTAFQYCAGPACLRTTPKTPLAKPIAVQKLAAPLPMLPAPPMAPSRADMPGTPTEPNWRIFRTRLGTGTVLNAQHRVQLKVWHRSSRRDVSISRYEIAASGPDRLAHIQALTRGLRALGVPASAISAAVRRPLPFGVNAEVRIVEWRPLESATSAGGVPASDATPAPAQAGGTSIAAPSASHSSGASP